MKNGWIWVPVAGVLGLIVGAWGPREELREREKKAAEEKVKAIRETMCKYFECNPWTGKENPNYDPDFSATDAIDQIVEILS